MNHRQSGVLLLALLLIQPCLAKPDASSADDDEEAEAGLSWSYQRWTFGVSGSLAGEIHRNAASKGANKWNTELDPVFALDLAYALPDDDRLVVKVDTGLESWRPASQRKPGNREAYLGYQSDTWGTVKLGTNGSPSWRLLDEEYGTHGLNWPVSYSGYGRLNVLRMADWVKNTLAYASPEYAGFSGELAVLLADNDWLERFHDVLLHYAQEDRFRVDLGFVGQQTDRPVAPLRQHFLAGEYSWQSVTLSLGYKHMAQDRTMDRSVIWSQLGYAFGQNELHLGVARVKDRAFAALDIGTMVLGTGYTLHMNQYLDFYSDLTWARNRADGGIGASDVDPRYSLGSVRSSQWITGLSLDF
ncbi:hypothetical protein GCM10007350_05770 [Jeongeupia chitinilytica]|uniref:Porin domain-containing protein n=2 Tax=Jeongeupia chitinilytica TaxID=1041641 RepID=A0ABQ3GVP5_9NEIS|nr:hypothetical protein GCM10007350_05770 [Jeongeupia chitinilytica]